MIVLFRPRASVTLRVPMTRDEIRSKVLDLADALRTFDEWDAETDRPKMAEVEFDDVWKLVVIQENGFRTIKIHERLTNA